MHGMELLAARLLLVPAVVCCAVQPTAAFTRLAQSAQYETGYYCTMYTILSILPDQELAKNMTN